MSAQRVAANHARFFGRHIIEKNSEAQPSAFNRRNLLAGGTALGLLSVIDSAASQSSWPRRPIKFIVPTGPGLATDIVARLTADRLSRVLGQQVYVENVAGAAGMIGAQVAARAQPDGYTFYFAPSSPLSSNVVLYKAVPYNPITDFTPVAMVCNSAPFALAIDPKLPINNLAELISFAKSRSGTVTYAVDTSSGYAVVLGRLLAKRGEFDWTQVPYKSTPQMLQDTATGVVQAMIGSVGATMPFASTNRLRIIAISSASRLPGLSEFPTMSETIPSLVVDGWYAIVAPVNTPASIVEQLNKAIDPILREESFSAHLRTLGLTTGGASTPHDTGELIRSQIEFWRKLAEELGIQPQ